MRMHCETIGWTSPGASPARWIRGLVIVTGLFLTTSGSSGGCCDSGGNDVTVAPPLDLTYCSFTAVPCMTGDRDPNTLQPINCKVAPCTDSSGNSCNDDFTRCTTCKTKDAAPANSGMGFAQCFDHNAGVTAQRACDELCEASPQLPYGTNTIGDSAHPFDYPAALRPTWCKAQVDFGAAAAHQAYDSTSTGASQPDYVQAKCMNYGGTLGTQAAGTHRESLMGSGTFQSPGNGVAPDSAAVIGGLLNLSALKTSCNALESTCPVTINQMEVDFDDFVPIVSGNSHPTQKMILRLDTAFVTPSGTFFPAGGGLPASFSFEIPSGVVFDSVSMVDGNS
jgi:hypothetical protein